MKTLRLMILLVALFFTLGLKPSLAAWDEYDEIRSAAWAEYDKIRSAAWDRISAGLDSPLVTWIIQNCSSHRVEAIKVLRSLPCSLSELDDIAEQNGWCDQWKDFRSAALRDGVVSE